MSTAVGTSFQLRVNGTPVHVRVAGEGPPVLLLHGGGPGTSGEGWVELMNLMAPRFKLFAPDYPGFGESALPVGERSVGRLINDMRELMRLLCLERVALVGHSMGAIVAASLVVQLPAGVRHLVLIAPGGGSYGIEYSSPGIAAIARASADPSEKHIRDLVALMSARPDLHEQETAKRLAALQRPGVLEMQRDLQAARNADKAHRGALLGDQVRRLEIPIALLWGAEERFNPFEIGSKIHTALPDHAAYHVIPGAGHNVHYDRPQEVAGVLSAFLSH